MGPYLTIAEKVFDDGNVLSKDNMLKYCKSQSYTPDKYFYLLETPAEKDILRYSKDHEFNLSKYFSETHLLGEYEAAILSKMIFRTEKYISIIFGALGSGKSTTLRFVLNYFDKNLKFKYKKNMLSPVYIDLNAVGDLRNYENEQTYFNEIFSRISEKIETALTKKYPNEEFYHFWLNCVKTAREYDNFSWVYTINNVLSELKPENALRILRQHVDEFKPENRFRFWSLLLSVESLVSKSKVDSFIVIDNIDQHASLLQNRLLIHLQQVCQETNRVRILVAMRVITFGNTWGDVKKYLIPNCSLFPNQILMFRIEDFILDLRKNRIENLPLLKDYQKATLFVLLLEIFYLLKDPKSKLFKSLSAISGLSIRRGLNLATYLFQQENTPFDRITQISTFIENDGLTEKILDDLNDIRSENIQDIAEKYFYLIRDMRNVEDNHWQIVYYLKDTFYCNLLYYRSFHEIIEEKLIENIFHKQNKKLSMVKIRILFYLSDNKVGMIKDLYNYINRFIHNIDDFIYAVNSLSSQFRRLIFFDGPVNFNDSNHLNIYFHKRIILTETGKGYVNFLSNNYEYIQFCLLERGEHFGSKSGIESLAILVKNVFALISLDIEETTDFWKTFNIKSKFREQCEELLSFRVLHSFIDKNILNSLENLLHRRKGNELDSYALRDIVLSLESNFNLLENNIDKLFGKIPESLQDLRAKFERLKGEFLKKNDNGIYHVNKQTPAPEKY